METATVVRLKSQLSRYLRRVKAGEDVIVTERGVPIARLVPVDKRTSVALRPPVRAQLIA